MTELLRGTLAMQAYRYEPEATRIYCKGAFGDYPNRRREFPEKA